MSAPGEEVAVAEGETSAPQPVPGEKHYLEHSWTLYYDNNLNKQSVNKFGQSLREIYKFNTVEDFWALYNNIRTPGQLSPNATFYLFKDDIEPKWEDKNNEHGGSWTVSCRGTNPKAILDHWWLTAVLACIGEQFECGDEVNGIAVNVRSKGDRVELWTKTASNEAAQMSVGRQFKQFLEVPGQIGFGVFADKLSSNKAKDRYVV